MGTAMEATAAGTASALLRLSPLLSTTSQSMDTTGTTASAPLMLSLLPSTMPTPSMDTTMVKDYSRPQVCRKPLSTISQAASCNIVVGCFQQQCVPTCSKAFPIRLTKKPMPSNSCNSFTNCNDKISFRFSSPLPCLSVFDLKRNSWINLAQSAIPKELESQIHVISTTKNSQSSTLNTAPSTYPTCKCRESSGASRVDNTEALANPRRVLIS